MPPRFHVTRQQRRALEALEWLHDESPEGTNRRSGRTWVLALSYVRRLVLDQGRNRLGARGELDIQDHIQMRRSSDVLIDCISAICNELELDVTLDRQRSRIRLERLPFGAHYAEVVNALTTFGERLDPPTTAPQTMKRAVKPDRLSAPGKTIWDHILDDSDGI